MTEAGITALLGPTNTGKTHRAIERMLEHSSGMMGLPLRLLAREVYDRVTARVGEERVALVTGEEQRIPARPSYWIATVEAMPIDREVDFLAVDEIQLAAHDQRGHVFTSRLLSARGRRETWFLGAASMDGILRELVPTARHVEHPRLSQLTYAGASPLARVPPRSAVVAFSMPHVYELADRIRARRGGAAVVLGALSPRTRNAQVAMFQSGEVDALVATDAIGMGLNLDIGHVAFAAIRKFDGKDVRFVDDAELAQIAGRAGRWIENGTFGTVTPTLLTPPVVHAIEAHVFAPVRRVQWRNDALEFSSLAALRASLAEPPKRKIFRHATHADDAMALAHLAAREAIARRATSEDTVRLLWEVCTIPDFRKLLFEAHVAVLDELFDVLVRRGRLDDDFMARQLRDVDDDRGDVETLVARIAAVRTWTYVSNRSTWLDTPLHWQERTRALEDRLSDALHERLVARFVEGGKGARRGPTARKRVPLPPESSGIPLDRGSAPDPSHPFAKLAAFRAGAIPAPAPSQPSEWALRVIDARHDAIALEASGAIVFRETKRVLGAIVRGASIALPDVKLAEHDDLGAGTKSRLHRRLLAFARDVVAAIMGGAADMAKTHGAARVRGLAHRLEQGLGTVLARDVDDLTSALDHAERAALDAAGVQLGAAVVAVTKTFDPELTVLRVALASIWFSTRVLQIPSRSAVSFVPPRGARAEAFLAIGYPLFATRAVRADIAERIATEGASVDPTTIASWLGCSVREVHRVRAAIDGSRASAPSHPPSEPSKATTAADGDTSETTAAPTTAPR